MNDKIFLDTNVLIYAYSIDERKKKEIVTAILQKYERIFLSTQVLNEFIHVMSKKRKLDLDNLKEVIQEICQNFSIAMVGIETIEKAMSLALKHKYQYFDCLIIASALENDCVILFSEDMHNQHVLQSTLKIINPFT